MSVFLLLLTFILGCLVGVGCVGLRRTIRLNEQWAVERGYEALLWKQLGQLQKLLRSNDDLLTDNIKLKQKYIALQHKHEKMMAALN